MLHLGDVCKIDGSKITPVDVITFGSPCQDLSVAGRREGLSGERSGLFMEAVRIIKEMRNATAELSMRGSDVNIRPTTAIWENVPGAFSSGKPKGADFRCVLEELARVKDPQVSIPMPDKWMPSGCIEGSDWSIAWRTHDAQYWGVPQRRRRISVIARFDNTDAANILFQLFGETDSSKTDKTIASARGESRQEVLAVPESMSRNLETSREQREEITRTTGEDTQETIRAISFQERAGKPGGGVKESLSKMTESDQWEQAPTNTLSASEVYGISPYDSNAMKSHNPDSGIYKADTSRTLDNNGGNPACNQGGMVVIEHAVCIGGGMVNDAVCPSDEVCKCLNCMDDTMKVVVEPVCVGNGQLAQARLQDTVGTLNCMHDQQAVIAPVLAFDRAAYNQGMNAQYDFSIEEELAQTIVAKGPGGVMQTQ